MSIMRLWNVTFYAYIRGMKTHTIRLKNSDRDLISVRLFDRVAPHTFEAECPNCEDGIVEFEDIIEDEFRTREVTRRMQCSQCDGRAIVQVPCCDVHVVECQDCINEENE
jgi:hypothetical protein